MAAAAVAARERTLGSRNEPNFSFCECNGGGGRMDQWYPHRFSIRWPGFDCFINGPFTASFSLFLSFQYSWLWMFNTIFCRWLDSNRGPVESEATLYQLSQRHCFLGLIVYLTSIYQFELALTSLDSSHHWEIVTCFLFLTILNSIGFQYRYKFLVQSIPDRNVLFLSFYLKSSVSSMKL